MSAALVGISAVQVYWIKWSLELDAKKFDERVFSTLKNVSDYIEKYDLDRQEKTRVLAEPDELRLFEKQKDYSFSLTDTLSRFSGRARQSGLLMTHLATPLAREALPIPRGPLSSQA